MSEVWRDIPGYEGRYQISDLGRVKSLGWLRTAPNGGGGWVATKILRPGLSANGYPSVALRANATPKTFMLHHLVAEAFIGPRPQGMYVLHSDGNRLNNLPSNLRYGTPSENCYDTVAHGMNRQANQTSCVHGHPFDEANTYIRPRGGRDCRACRRDRRARHEARRAGVAA